MGIDMYTSAPAFPRHHEWLDKLEAEYQAEWAARDAGKELPRSDTWERYQADEKAWEAEHGVHSRRLGGFVCDLLKAAGFDIDALYEGGTITVAQLRAAAAMRSADQFQVVAVNDLGEKFDVYTEAAKRLTDLADACERYGDAGVDVC